MLLLVINSPVYTYLFKALCKLVYVKPISCKCMKTVRRVCKQLKCFKVFYKVDSVDTSKSAFQQMLFFGGSEQA